MLLLLGAVVPHLHCSTPASLFFPSAGYRSVAHFQVLTNTAEADMDAKLAAVGTGWCPPALTGVHDLDFRLASGMCSSSTAGVLVAFMLAH